MVVEVVKEDQYMAMGKRKIERPFARCHEKGLLVRVVGFNLGLGTRVIFGIGKPRRVQVGLPAGVWGVSVCFVRVLGAIGRRWNLLGRIWTFAAVIILLGYLECGVTTFT